MAKAKAKVPKVPKAPKKAAKAKKVQFDAAVVVPLPVVLPTTAAVKPEPTKKKRVRKSRKRTPLPTVVEEPVADSMEVESSHDPCGVPELDLAVDPEEALTEFPELDMPPIGTKIATPIAPPIAFDDRQPKVARRPAAVRTIDLPGELGLCVTHSRSLPAGWWVKFTGGRGREVGAHSLGDLCELLQANAEAEGYTEPNPAVSGDRRPLQIKMTTLSPFIKARTKGVKPRANAFDRFVGVESIRRAGSKQNLLVRPFAGLESEIEMRPATPEGMKRPATPEGVVERVRSLFVQRK